VSREKLINHFVIHSHMKRKKNMTIRICVRIPEPIYDKLVKQSMLSGNPLSSVIRDLLRNGLEGKK